MAEKTNFLGANDCIYELFPLFGSWGVLIWTAGYTNCMDGRSGALDCG
jgi:hypothetical protein